MARPLLSYTLLFLASEVMRADDLSVVEANARGHDGFPLIRLMMSRYLSWILSTCRKAAVLGQDFGLSVQRGLGLLVVKLTWREIATILSRYSLEYVTIRCQPGYSQSGSPAYIS
jgi:hypothetical protein